MSNRGQELILKNNLLSNVIKMTMEGMKISFKNTHGYKTNIRKLANDYLSQWGINHPSVITFKPNVDGGPWFDLIYYSVPEKVWEEKRKKERKTQYLATKLNYFETILLLSSETKLHFVRN